MQHYFAKSLEKQRFYFTTEDEHHIRNVMRFHNGDKVMVIFEAKKYLSILHLDNQNIYADLEQEIPTPVKNYRVHLIQSLIKGEKFDLLLQKVTELGVDTIVPYLAERSIIKLEPKDYAKKQLRWWKIAKEASEQSERNTIPEITNPVTLKELDQYFKGTVILLDERLGREKNKTLLSYLLEHKDQEYTLIIGPEGGFSDNEFAYFASKSIVSLSLGTQILRSETASMMAVGLVCAHEESK